MTDEGTDKKLLRCGSTVATWVDQKGNVRSKTEKPTKNKKRKPNIVIIQSGNGITIAELEEMWNSLKPDDRKRINEFHDPRRARPI